MSTYDRKLEEVYEKLLEAEINLEIYEDTIDFLYGYIDELREENESLEEELVEAKEYIAELLGD